MSCFLYATFKNKGLKMHYTPIANDNKHGMLRAMDAIFPFLGLFFVFLLMAQSAVYGSSQARGRTGAAAAGLHHSYAGSKPYLPTMLQLSAMPDP